MAELATTTTTGGAVGDTAATRPGYVIKDVVVDGLYAWGITPGAPEPDGAIKTYKVTELPNPGPGVDTNYILFASADPSDDGYWFFSQGEGYFRIND